MAKRGRKPRELMEIYGGNSEGKCDSSVYGRKENDKYIFTDIRTLVDFQRYSGLEKCEDFTDTNITAVERYRRYLTAKKFDVDCNYSTRKSYKFKVMMDLYRVLWDIDSHTILNSAETIVSLNQVINRWNSNLCNDKPGRKSVDFEKIEKLTKTEAQDFEKFVYDIATLGNFMPVVGIEQTVLNRFNERFDRLLEAIKEFYMEGKKHKHFEANKDMYEWLNLYEKWSNFVDKNYLKESFVDENYNVVEYDGKLSQLSNIIYIRSVNMIQKYEEITKRGVNE